MHLSVCMCKCSCVLACARRHTKRTCGCASVGVGVCNVCALLLQYVRGTCLAVCVSLLAAHKPRACTRLVSIHMFNT